MVELLGGRGVETLGDGSLAGAVRADGWPALRVGWLQRLAALAAAGDLSTTYVVLTSETYIEYNPLLSGLAEDALALALGYFLLLNGWYLSIAVLDLGWVSTASGTYLVGVMGSATVNNLVLFVTGTSLLDVLGGSTAWALKSWVVVGIALVVVVRLHDRVPTWELLAVAVVYGGGELVV